MLHIYNTACISPQQTFEHVDITHVNTSKDSLLHLIEPAYKNIPPGILRRMSKTVKSGIAAAMPLLEQADNVGGIIIGTANGGIEESVKFLNQMIAYDEGLLTPGDFVQSTANSVAAQLGLMTANRLYNSTHVHKGFSFENALLDTMMLAAENPQQSFLTGAVDVISPYNYNIDRLAGCFKDEPVSNNNLYSTDSKGTMAGEGAAMFLTGAAPGNSIAQLIASEMCYSANEQEVLHRLEAFLQKNTGRPGILLSGEDGDNRCSHFYHNCEKLLEGALVARFKHMCGDFATASAIALWLACYALQGQSLPTHMIKKEGLTQNHDHILIYNVYRQKQHSFMLVSK